MILEDTCAEMPHLISELERLRAALPETVAMMQQHVAGRLLVLCPGPA